MVALIASSPTTQVNLPDIFTRTDVLSVSMGGHDGLGVRRTGWEIRVDHGIQSYSRTYKGSGRFACNISSSLPFPSSP